MYDVCTYVRTRSNVLFFNSKLHMIWLMIDTGGYADTLQTQYLIVVAGRFDDNYCFLVHIPFLFTSHVIHTTSVIHMISLSMVHGLSTSLLRNDPTAMMTWSWTQHWFTHDWSPIHKIKYSRTNGPTPNIDKTLYHTTVVSYTIGHTDVRMHILRKHTLVCVIRIYFVPFTPGFMHANTAHFDSPPPTKEEKIVASHRGRNALNNEQGSVGR